MRHLRVAMQFVEGDQICQRAHITSALFEISIQIGP
jgi:hypothetical protein